MLCSVMPKTASDLKAGSSRVEVGLSDLSDS